MLLRTLLLVALGLAAAGCDRFDAPLPSPSASARAAPSADGASTEETHRLARAAVDAALACARTCVIHAQNFNDAADACPPDAALVKALDESARALAAHVQKDGVRGDAAAFSKVASLFADWVHQGAELEVALAGAHRRDWADLGADLGPTRGTLRLFQDVADAWNHYQPGEPVPVDPVEEYRAYGFGSKGYIMKPVPKAGKRIAWKSCYDGPCLWEDHY